MTFLDLALGRRSIRKFGLQPIEKWQIDALLLAMTWAPSAGNLQACRFVVVTHEKTKEGLAKASLSQMFIAEAPLVMVVCADQHRSAHKYGERGATLYSILDAAAAIQNCLLEAHDMGLGACWIGAFDETQVQDILGLPVWLRPIGVVPIGHPAEVPLPPTRLRIDESTFYFMEEDDD